MACLSNKEAEKKLELRFFEKDNKLHCIIEDNGVGRAKAAEIKKQKMASHRFESKGMKMALQRAAILNKEQAGSAVIETTDLFDAQNNASGTRITVILSMYFSNPLKPGT